MNKTKAIALLKELLQELEQPEKEIDILWNNLTDDDKKAALKLSLSSKVISEFVDNGESVNRFQKAFHKLSDIEQFRFCESIKEFEKTEVRLDEPEGVNQVIIFKELDRVAIARNPYTKSPFLLRILGREDEIEIEESV